MDKVEEMGDGIVVKDAPVHRTMKEEAMARGKRSATAGKEVHSFIIAAHVRNVQNDRIKEN